MYMLNKNLDKLIALSKVKIRAERIALELTQEEFADFVDIKYATYKTFEQSGKISFENYLKILHTPEQFGQPADLHPDTLPELIRTASRFIFGQF